MELLLFQLVCIVEAVKGTGRSLLLATLSDSGARQSFLF